MRIMTLFVQDAHKKSVTNFFFIILMSNMSNAEEKVNNINDINTNKAFYWYEKAAETGDVLEQYNLALLYEKGKGIEKHLEKAFYWYQNAAENGVVLTQYNLGNCYENGIGVVKDE